MWILNSIHTHTSASYLCWSVLRSKWTTSVGCSGKGAHNPAKVHTSSFYRCTLTAIAIELILERCLVPFRYRRMQGLRGVLCFLVCWRNRGKAVLLASLVVVCLCSAKDQSLLEFVKCKRVDRCDESFSSFVDHLFFSESNFYSPSNK